MRSPFHVVAFLLASFPVLAQSTLPKRAGTQPQATSRRSATLPTPTQSLRYAERITPTGLRQDLTVLASDAYEGRATGQQGQRLAAAYLANAFAKAGLAGPVAHTPNPFYQRFSLTRTGIDSTSSVTIGGRTFVVNKDFYVLVRNPAAASVPMQPAFVGYGISAPGYADFTPADPTLKGKDLILLLGEPQTQAGSLLGKDGQPSPYGTPGFAEVLARSPSLSSVAPRSTFRIMPSAAALARVPQDYAALYGWQEQITFPGAAVPPLPPVPTFFLCRPRWAQRCWAPLPQA
jgi:hypothetical protein